MSDHELSPEQEAELELLAQEVVREATRVGVDWEAATTRMRALADPELVGPVDGDGGEVVIGLDMTVLLETLRRLPDGAGTERFLAEYEAAELGDEPAAE